VLCGIFKHPLENGNKYPWLKTHDLKNSMQVNRKSVFFSYVNPHMSCNIGKGGWLQIYERCNVL